MATQLSVSAFDNATVQPGGPRSGSNGKIFFNIQGSANGGFASFGVTDFDLSTLAPGFTVGNILDSASLSLVESNAFFTANGGYSVYFTEAVDESIQPGSPLNYQGGNGVSSVDPLLTNLSFLGSFNFVENGDGSVDTVDLTLSAPAEAYIIEQLNDADTDDTLRLVLVPDEPSVSATYAGQGNFDGPAPTFVFDVEEDTTGGGDNGGGDNGGSGGFQAADLSLAAFDNATVQPGGPRSGDFGKIFFNIEGSANGGFASFGVADFDLNALNPGFAVADVTDTLTLDIVESNAGFTTNGAYSVYFTDAVDVSIQPGSPLNYQSGNDGVASVDPLLTNLSFLGSFTFVENGDGSVDTVDLTLSSAAEAYIIEQFKDADTDDVLRLVFAPDEPAVAATYAGQDNFDGPAPTLNFSVNNGVSDPTSAIINEFVFNHVSFDTFEYVEILATPNTDLSNLTVLEIEGDSTGAGTVDEVITLGTTDANGFFTTSFLADAFENGSVSLLLVENFTGAFGQDLDTDNDGVLDITPWDSVLDAIAVSDGGSSDQTYADVVFTPGFDGFNSFTAGGASRIPNGVDTDTLADWVRNDFDLAGIAGFAGTPEVGEAFNTPGAENAVVTGSDLPPTPAAIFEIQGAAQVSPLVGERVITSGIVTAIAGNGYYLQDAVGDNDIATSDAIFVQGSTSGVVIGDEVEVTGTVTEIDPEGGGADLDITAILASNSTVLSSGNALPAAVIIGANGRPVPTESIDDSPATFDPTTDGADFFESLESMRVTATDLVAVAGTNRFGEIFAVTDQGANATGISDRGTLNISPDDFNPEKIQIDADFAVSGFEVPFVNTGATLGDVTGVVSYDFGNYQIIPTEDFRANVVDSTLQAEVTTIAGTADRLTVASYNVLNLDPNDSPSETQADADIASGRFDAIAQKIVSNLGTPDIVGLQEIQDNSGGTDNGITAADVTLQTLVDAIVTAGGPQYEFIDNTFIGNNVSGGQPGANIRTAFLYNPERVDVIEGSIRPVGSQAPGQAFNGARLPLAADFTFNGETVTVVNNHFSSKGGSAPIVGQEQPFEERQEEVAVNGSLDERQAQSRAVQDFVTDIFSTAPDANVVVLGDLNEFEFVSPVLELETNARLNNLTNTLPENERYTFIFQGNSQSLDHILVSDSLVAGAEFDIVHVNPEFAEVSGRASDHEPLVASLNFAPPEPTIFTLELLHIADQEAGARAVDDAPRLSAVLNALRAQDLGNDGLADNTLTLSSGDAFIPGLFFDASETVFGAAGIADIQIQNELGIQAIALGNHEFDFGTSVLAALIDGSAPGDFTALTGTALDGQAFTGTAFPYLSSNLDFSTDENLAPLAVAGGQAPQGNVVTSSTVIDVNGENIGVVGATTPTLAIISNPGGVGIAPADFDATPTPAQLDALAAEIQTEVDALLAADPSLNKVVLLAHMQQINIELALAARLQNVDIIVAGGSNTRLFDDNDRPRAGDSDQGQYPQFVTNAGGTQTAVVNTDGSYKYVGRLVLDFDADGNILPDSYDAAVSGAYATDAQGVNDLNAAGLVDPEIQAIADAIEAQIIATESNVFGIAEVFLNGNRSGLETPDDPDGVRTQETNLGNLTADANLVIAREFDTAVVVSIKNGGGIRASIGQTVVPPGGSEAVRLPNEEIPGVKPEGGISQNDIQTALAFNNGLTLLTLTKAELVAVLEHGVSAIPGVSGRFPQISGVKFSYDPDLPAGDRLLNAGIFDANDTLIAELVRDGDIVGDPSEPFRIVTLNFLAGGGDGYPFPTGPAANRVDLYDLDGDGVDDNALTGDATFAADGTEQDALAEYLVDNFLNTPFAELDTGRAFDERIQNLNFREDTVLGDAAPLALTVGLFDATGNDTLIATLVDGIEITASAIENINPTLAAFIPADSPFFGQVGSVRIDVNGGDKTQVENIEPFALFGDRRGNLRGGDLDLVIGENTVTFEIFSQSNAKGELLDTVTLDFFVIDDGLIAPPIVTNDVLTVLESETAGDVDINILANDLSGTGDPIAVLGVGATPGNVGTAVAGANGGLFTLNSDGSTDFDASGDFEFLAVGETATTTVEVVVGYANGIGPVSTAELTVTVEGENDAPIALDDNVLLSGSSVVIDVLANDNDPDVSDELAIVEFTSPNAGEVVRFENEFIYTPGDAFAGTDSFTYTLADSAGATATATVTVREELVGNGVSIGLFDAESDTLIRSIQDGDEIVIGTARQNLTIAVFVPEDSPLFGEVESVFLNLNNGAETAVENVEPYALFGDVGGDFGIGDGLPLGNNTLEVELFSQNKLNGDLLDTVTRSFTLIQS